jgi:hypothetical protein
MQCHQDAVLAPHVMRDPRVHSARRTTEHERTPPMRVLDRDLIGEIRKPRGKRANAQASAVAANRGWCLIGSDGLGGVASKLSRRGPIT